MQQGRYCYITGRTDTLQLHHIYGGANRKNSDKYGCWCWLTADIHRAAHDTNQELLKQLRQECQERFEETHTRDEFRRIFGKSYL